MPSYKVLISHNGLRRGDVTELPDSPRLVRNGYLRSMEVKAVERVPDAAGPDLRADADPVPARRRKSRKAEVSDHGDVEAGPVGDSPDGTGESV